MRKSSSKWGPGYGLRVGKKWVQLRKGQKEVADEDVRGEVCCGWMVRGPRTGCPRRPCCGGFPCALEALAAWGSPWALSQNNVFKGTQHMPLVYTADLSYVEIQLPTVLKNKFVVYVLFG